MLDLEKLEDQIMECSARYRDAMQRYAAATMEHNDTKKMVDERRNYLISKGVEGSNAEIRKANLEKELAHEYEILDEKDLELAAARLYLDTSASEVAEMRSILKLAELQTNVQVLTQGAELVNEVKYDAGMDTAHD